MPGALDPLRVGEHVHADELDPNAPQDAPLLSLLARADARAPGRVPRAPPRQPAQWCAAARRRSPTARGSSSSRTRPPVIASRRRADRPTDRRAHPAADARTAEARGAAARRRRRRRRRRRARREQKGRLRAWVATVPAGRRCEGTRSYVTQTGDFVREPIADTSHRTARTAPRARPPPCLPPITPDGAAAHPPPARPPSPPPPVLTPARVRLSGTSTSTSPSCSSSARRGATFPAAASAAAGVGRRAAEDRGARASAVDLPSAAATREASAPVRRGELPGQTMATELKGACPAAHGSTTAAHLHHLHIHSPVHLHIHSLRSPPLLPLCTPLQGPTDVEPDAPPRAHRPAATGPEALINLHDELTFNVFDKVKTEADARGHRRRCATTPLAAASRCRSRSTATARSRRVPARDAVDPVGVQEGRAVEVVRPRAQPAVALHHRLSALPVKDTERERSSTRNAKMQEFSKGGSSRCACRCCASSASATSSRSRRLPTARDAAVPLAAAAAAVGLGSR